MWCIIDLKRLLAVSSIFLTAVSCGGGSSSSSNSSDAESLSMDDIIRETQAAPIKETVNTEDLSGVWVITGNWIYEDGTIIEDSFRSLVTIKQNPEGEGELYHCLDWTLEKENVTISSSEVVINLYYGDIIFAANNDFTELNSVSFVVNEARQDSEFDGSMVMTKIKNLEPDGTIAIGSTSFDYTSEYLFWDEVTTQNESPDDLPIFCIYETEFNYTNFRHFSGDGFIDFPEGIRSSGYSLEIYAGASPITNADTDNILDLNLNRDLNSEFEDRFDATDEGLSLDARYGRAILIDGVDEMSMSTHVNSINELRLDYNAGSYSESLDINGDISSYSDRTISGTVSISFQ